MKRHRFRGVLISVESSRSEKKLSMSMARNCGFKITFDLEKSPDYIGSYNDQKVQNQRLGDS